MLLAGALALVLLAPDQDPPQVVVNAQWSLGRFVPGDWLPVVVDLQNAGGRDLDVRLKVEDEALRSRVLRRETLPAGVRRRIFIELPGGTHARMFGYGVRPKVTVETPEGQVLARFELTSAGDRDDALEVVLVSPVRGSDGAFRFPRQSGKRNVDLHRADAGLLPARWTGYTGVDLLVLHDAPLDELSPDQARAILDWVRLGGTLALSPGARQGWLSHPVLAALATIDAGPPETRTSLPGLARKHPALFAAGRPFLHHPIRNGDLVRDTDTRLFPCGLGRVRVLPFDVGVHPFAEAAGLEAVWLDLLRDVRSPAVTVKPDDILAAPAVLSRISTLINPYPSFTLLAGLTAVFLAVVGPINWLVLRRLRMSLLLILTVPGLSLLFLGLTVGLGYFFKGTGTLVASVRFITAPSGVDTGVETQLLSVRSPSTRDYRLALPGRAALPAEWAAEDRYAFEQPGGGMLEIEDGPWPAFSGFRIGQWQTRRIVAKAPVDLGEGIRVESGGGRLRVVNGSPRRIVRGLYVRPGPDGSAAPFGAVAPGASAEAPLEPGRWKPMEDLGFAEGSLGYEALEGLLSETPYRTRREGPTETMLLAVLDGEDPGLEIDTGYSPRSRTVTILLIRPGTP